MTFHIDPKKSARENLLALVNHANSADLTQDDVVLTQLQALEGVGEGVRNTSILLDPKPEGRFSVSAGGVTVNYRRLSFAELIQSPVEIKATRSTTLTEIHQAICNAYGLILDGVVTTGALPANGTILPGETFEVSIEPSQEGDLVYYPKSRPVTITWDGVWLEALVTNTDLNGFQAVQRKETIYRANFEVGETANYTFLGGAKLGIVDGRRVLLGSDREEVTKKKTGLLISTANAIDLRHIDFEIEYEYKHASETYYGAFTMLELGGPFPTKEAALFSMGGSAPSCYFGPYKTGSAKGIHRPNSWNKYTLTRRGNSYSIKINDVVVIDVVKDGATADYSRILSGDIRLGTSTSMSSFGNNYNGCIDNFTINKLL